MDIDHLLLKELKEKVSVAEKHLNHLESMANSGTLATGLDIPSINELRYALNHLLRYLTDENESDGINSAIKHTKRAIYDCYETEALYHFNIFCEFETNNQDIMMKDVFPNFLDWAKTFSELQEFIRNSDRENRDKYYDELEKMLDLIRPFHHEIRAVQQEILKIRNEKEEIKKSESLALSNANRTIKLQKYGLIVTALIALVAVANLLINFNSSHKNSSSSPSVTNPATKQ